MVETADEIAAGFAHIRLIQTDLNVMAGLIHGAEAVISVETGFAHLAAALGRPTVTLYGPSGTRRHATCGPLKTQLVSSIDCSPCYARRCALLDGAPGLAPCMSELDSRQVWNAACQLMADGKGTNRSQHPVIDPAKA